MNNTLKHLLVGMRLSAYIIIPFWVITGVIDYMYPVILNNKNYVVITQILLAVTYFASPMYCVFKKNIVATIGAFAGGTIIIAISFFIGLGFSCSQGVCF